MPRRRFQTEEIIQKLREAEVPLSQPPCLRGLSSDRCDSQHVLSLAEGIRRRSDGSGKASEGTGAGERPVEEAGGRGGTGQGHPARGRLGKLLSPAQRRRTVEHVREALGPDHISERRACRVLGQPRSTQRRTRHVPEDEPRLVRRIIDLAT